ncbi:MAG: pseudouridine synthase [Patescibacteria group bacterium]
MGTCARREADRLMEAGRILVTGERATVGMKIDGTEEITLDGKVLVPVTKKVYIAYHKPIGIICTSDPKADDNIIDAIGYPERLFHIGRLDVASSGLILLTNDGDIVNRILRAETQHEKEYLVRVNKRLRDSALEHMQEGMFIEGDDRKTLPAYVEQINNNTFLITIIEGRNRQIRKMCEAEGYEVLQLRRERVMHITLENLPVGHWRHLTPDEEQKLIRSTHT